jgi:hypothetical protein
LLFYAACFSHNTFAPILILVEAWIGLDFNPFWLSSSYRSLAAKCRPILLR